MAALAPSRPTLKAQRFLDANADSPVVYASSEGEGCFYRLKNGQTFDLTDADCRSIANVVPWWAWG